MVIVTRSLSVSQIAPPDRVVLEQIVGQPLSAQQEVVIQVITPEKTKSDTPDEGKLAELPEWCRLYEGMSDDEIAALERTILSRADLTREFK